MIYSDLNDKTLSLSSSPAAVCDYLINYTDYAVVVINIQTEYHRSL